MQDVRVSTKKAVKTAIVSDLIGTEIQKTCMGELLVDYCFDLIILSALPALNQAIGLRCNCASHQWFLYFHRCVAGPVAGCYLSKNGPSHHIHPVTFPDLIVVCFVDEGECQHSCFFRLVYEYGRRTSPVPP
jgi:hypothetical protein